jgi:hypothetical protein
MDFQSELWIILQEDERSAVWDKVYSEFHFSPSINNKLSPFRFNIPFDSYDIHNSPIYNDNEEINGMIKSAFIECMGNDDFMYALDWQHICFRYNPRINAEIKYPVFIKDSQYSGGKYNVYFPEFYPNGDYYFFIAKDFSWGYLTHPWLKKAWVFGNKLMCLFQESAHKMGFVSCAKE